MPLPDLKFRAGIGESNVLTVWAIRLEIFENLEFCLLSPSFITPFDCDFEKRKMATAKFRAGSLDFAFQKLPPKIKKHRLFPSRCARFRDTVLSHRRLHRRYVRSNSDGSKALFQSAFLLCGRLAAFVRQNIAWRAFSIN